MGKNNVKVMTDDEIRQLDERYDFKVENDNVFIMIKGYNRTTVHPRGKVFSINAKIRKIDIEPEAVEMWWNTFRSKHSLFEVQNAINTLVVLYQSPTVEDVKKLFDRGNTTIREI